MATSNNLRKGLNRKVWEMCNPLPGTVGNGQTFIPAYHKDTIVMQVTGSANQWLYLPTEDTFIGLQGASLGGSFNYTTGCATAIGPTGTATAGTATTLTTNINLQRDLRGYKIHITGGPGAGDMVDIISNTIGTNAVITANFSTTITNASTYRLITPRWWVMNSGTLGTTGFRMYCWALNTWTTISLTSGPSSISSDHKLVSTPSYIDGGFKSFATGTATAGGASTITNGAKNWAVNQWANYQIRITAGTGSGQVRTISSNTATVITVSSAWTTQPDNTSQYTIEGNDDFIYWFGNSGTSVLRYAITAGTWSSLATRTAPGAGVSGNWIYDVTETDWTDENNILNGRRIYSFRGANGNILDFYDIPSNAWTSNIDYSPKNDTWGTGTSYVYNKNFIYIHQNNGGRWIRYNLATRNTDGWHNTAYPQPSSTNSEKAFYYVYKDGGTEIPFIYFMLHGTNVMLRSIII